MISMTYGVLPTFEQYDAEWDRLDKEGELRGGLFHFGNDSRVGNCALDKFQLWKEIEKAHKKYEELLDPDEDPESVGNWLSCVLGCLGFEWV